MSRHDGLWIGLKLLGVYLVISGLADFALDATRNIRAIVHFVCGMFLLSSADYFAPLERRRGPKPPSGPEGGDAEHQEPIP